ncbi:MAG TPA: SHOCT domain-containing protein [Thermoplasmata archaeon]|nr:SHOCT domain-containing protein [Thermoplasmata archaeon]
MNNAEWHGMRRIVTVGLLALVILVGIGIAASAFFALRGAGAAPAYYPFSPFGWFFGFFWIFLLFFAIRWWVWGGWGGRWRYPGYYGSYGRHDPAHSILRERYARGELTKEQFDQMTRDLEQQHP